MMTMVTLELSRLFEWFVLLLLLFKVSRKLGEV